MKDTFSDTKIFHQTVGFAITFEKSLDPVIHWPKIGQFLILLTEGQKTTRNKLVHHSKLNVMHVVFVSVALNF